MAITTLEELLDPKRAEREEGWHEFAQAYKESMLSLQGAIDKLSGKRKLAEGESVFTVLEKYAKEQATKADLDREKAQRLRDIVSASIPEVTEEQKKAYQSQKALYDQYQKELKDQTKAVTASAKAQAKAVEKAASEQVKAVNERAKTLKASSDDSIGNKRAQEFADFGMGASKIGGKGTVATQLFSLWKDQLGEQQAAREEEIDRAVAAEIESIEAQKAAQLEAIEEEKTARIAAVKEEVKARAKQAGVEKAPEDPEKIREQMIADLAKSAGRDREGQLAIASADKGPVVAKQQAEMKRELALEAQEERIRKEGGEFLAPAVEEDYLPGQAAPAPVAGPAPVEKAPGAASPVAKAVEAEGTQVTAAPADKAKAVAGSTSGEAAMAGMTKSLGSLASSGLKAAAWMGLVVKMLQDVNDTLPVISTSISAVSDASRLLGPTIMSVGMELGGYILELGAHVVEGIDRAISVRDTRAERLEKSGAIGAARTAREDADAKRKASFGSVGAFVGKSYGSISGAPSKLEATYTDPATAARLTSAPTEVQEVSKSSPTDQSAIAAQLENLVRLQQAQGNGVTPVNLSIPQLSF